jgi:CRP-like cAMP-binding protein
MRANRLLRMLPAADLDRLAGAVEFQRFEVKELVLERGQPIDRVLFPRSAVMSILTTMADGAGVEVTTVGNEGMVGVPLFLGCHSMPERELTHAWVPGDVAVMGADTFRVEMEAGGALHDIVQRYAQAFFSQLSRQVACNGLHSIEERCSRLLLRTRDRVASEEFPLTLEFLSEVLGVRRGSVRVALGVLQEAGLIRYHRGRLTVLDREGLEASSCECYGVIRAEFDRLLG